MGTDRLHLAVLPGLILLSLSPAERCSGSAGWVFTEPQLRARAGDSVLLQCLFVEPEAKGWTMDKVDWLHMAGPGAQKVGWDQGWALAQAAGGQARQPGCPRGAVGKPILEGSPVWWHLHRSPCPHSAGELQHRVLRPGAFQESMGASWALECNQRSTGRGTAWV